MKCARWPFLLEQRMRAMRKIDPYLEEHFVIVVDEERTGAELLHVGVV